MLQVLMAATLWLSGVAHAGGAASPTPPPPPTVDFAGLPPSADVETIQVDGQVHPVRARLLAESTTVPAGTSVRVGVHLTQRAGWHTYWKSPGDIGQPTDITWVAPGDGAVTPHQYPVPQRFEQDGLVSFGYDDQVLLVSTLTVPESLAPGTHELKAEVNWLVCASSCIPGSASLALPLEIVAAGTPPADVAGTFTPLFDHVVGQHPVDPLTVTALGFDMALSASAVRPNEPFKAAFLVKSTDGSPLTLASTHPWPTFTPIVGSDWMVTATRVQATSDGGILVTLDGETFDPDPLPAIDRVGGLFQIHTAAGWVRTEVEMAMPWQAAGSAVQDNTSSPLFQLAQGPTNGGGGGPVDPLVREAPSAEPLGPVSLLVNLGLAFLGGLLLNVMPCVLPVLTLKLYSLVEQTDITAAEQRRAGTFYTLGILASFWALAGTILVLRLAFGIEVDWGFQFQYPPYVAALATVVFAFGLSLFGVFEIPAFGVNSASEAAAKEGPAGYFFTGVFATLLATPCSAPFLGTAIAYAFTAPTPVLIGIFTLVGLGLAAPFLVIAFVPAAYALLPKPGAWMEAFKQLLGFTLVGTTVWLIDVLIAQVGADRAVGFMAFLVFVALACWVFGRWGGLGATGRAQLAAALGAMGIAGVAGVGLVDLQLAEAAACDSGEVRTDLSFTEEIPWQPFSEARVAALRGRPIFVDFTADWCLTCKVNERAILDTAGVRRAMAEHGVVPLKADWTRRDPTITEWLRRFGKAGVPFYLVLPASPDAEPIALPEVITQDLVIQALAGAK